MPHRGLKTFTVTMASGESLTAAFQPGGPWSAVYALIPSFSTNAAVEVFGSNDGTTYNRVMHPPINSSTVGTNAFVVASGVTGWVPIHPAGAFYSVKLHATGAVANGAEFKIICAQS